MKENIRENSFTDLKQGGFYVQEQKKKNSTNQLRWLGRINSLNNPGESFVLPQGIHLSNEIESLIKEAYQNQLIMFSLDPKLVTNNLWYKLLMEGASFRKLSSEWIANSNRFINAFLSGEDINLNSLKAIMNESQIYSYGLYKDFIFNDERLNTKKFFRISSVESVLKSNFLKTAIKEKDSEVLSYFLINLVKSGRLKEAGTIVSYLIDFIQNQRNPLINIIALNSMNLFYLKKKYFEKSRDCFEKVSNLFKHMSIFRSPTPVLA